MYVNEEKAEIVRPAKHQRRLHSGESSDARGGAGVGTVGQAAADEVEDRGAGGQTAV